MLQVAQILYVICDVQNTVAHISTDCFDVFLILPGDGATSTRAKDGTGGTR